MRKIIFSVAVASLIAFAVSCSSSNSGAEKFLGTWRELDHSDPDTLKITKGNGNTYTIGDIKNGQAVKEIKELKYDAKRDILFRNKGFVWEIVYNEDSSTIQLFVNHQPNSKPLKKIRE